VKPLPDYPQLWHFNQANLPGVLDEARALPEEGARHGGGYDQHEEERAADEAGGQRDRREQGKCAGTGAAGDRQAEGEQQGASEQGVEYPVGVAVVGDLGVKGGGTLALGVGEVPGMAIRPAPSRANPRATTAANSQRGCLFLFMAIKYLYGRKSLYSVLPTKIRESRLVSCGMWVLS